MIDACVADLVPLIGTEAACRAAGKAKATHYRANQPPKLGPPPPRPTPANALSDAEVDALLELLRSERFRDLAPAQVWAMLLDDDVYLASISTMYRVLRSHGEVRERRLQATHPDPQPARADGQRTESVLVVGHHQAPRPRQRRVVRPLRDHRHLLPLRRRLDGGAGRVGRAGRGLHRPGRRRPGHRAEER